MLKDSELSKSSHEKSFFSSYRKVFFHLRLLEFMKKSIEMGSDFKNCIFVNFWILFSIFCFFPLFCSSADRISRGEKLKDGDVIISAGQRFVLGFFRPEGSNLSYVGIWYREIPLPSQTVIWVANREKPISGDDGVLTIDGDGDLVVLDGDGRAVWSSNINVSSTNTTAVLEDSGNLVLRSGSRRPLWESFSHPTDTYLPGMRAYGDPTTGENSFLTSWKSASDPSPGNYSMGIDPRGAPQIVIWDGPKRHWRSGHWNGLLFTGVPDMRAIFLFGFRLTTLLNGTYYFTYTPSNISNSIKFQLHWNGHEEQRIWNETLRQWSLIQSKPGNECDHYNMCGPFAVCDSTKSPICRCVTGFMPKDFVEWNNGNWSGGCVRKTELQYCNRSGGSLGAEDGGEKDRFMRIEDVKLPDFLDYVGSENLAECEAKCFMNCSCIAYSFVNGINCMIWTNPLVDIQHFAQGGGNTLYLRLHSSEFSSSKTVTKLVIIVVVAVVLGMFFLFGSIWLLCKRRRKRRGMLKASSKLQEASQIRSGEYLTDFSGPGDTSVEGQQGTGPELAYFSFASVAAATNNFSDENKLGQGGFGHVYRGKLPRGEEIAVKRLSRKSGQGLEEFKNEIMLIAKLQHRNLVRLLGCCIYGEEKILLYEYMANKSLDSFLFDPAKQTLLYWKRRLSIIEGVARGLLYLHRDSRLRIIHRDLKASNILLDEEMNPKISDFGMARIFGGNENEANTNRVVGTYGYMAPEYAMEGLFSVKSDVYSFGVLILEIVSGRRNSGFRSAEYSNIIGFAWDLWEGDRAMELLDPSIADSSSQYEVMRCIHIAMLCVQDSATHRPNMSAVLLMLESEHANLPPPRQPTLTSKRISADLDMWNEKIEVLSSNDVTISTIIGR